MGSKLPGLRRSAINVGATWLLQAGTLLFALVSVPLVTRRFGLEGLGVWLLVQQLASHFQLLELGLASSLGRFLSRDHAQGNGAAYSAHSSSAIALLLGMGLVLMLMAYPIGQVFPQVFALPQDSASEGSWMLTIALVLTGMTLPLRSAIGVLASQHQFALQAGVDGIALLLRVSLVVAACTLVGDHALIALSLAVFGPAFLAALTQFLCAGRASPYALFQSGLIRRDAMRDLLDISLAAMIVTLSAVVLRQGSAMLLGYFAGVEAVALVALPVMLVVSLGPFLGIANQLMAPVASQLDAGNRLAELHGIYVNAARYTLMLGLFLFVAVIVLAPVVLPAWLGAEALSPDRARAMYIALLLIYAGYCTAIPAFLARTILVSVGRHRVAARGELMGALLGLTIGCVLTGIEALGPIGMAFGVAMSYLYRAWGLLARELARYFGVSLFALYGEIWLRPLFCALPLLGALLLITLFSPGLLGMVTIALSAVGLAAILAFGFVVSPAHRVRVREIFKRCWAKGGQS